jgi:hypothetical protein
MHRGIVLSFALLAGCVPLAKPTSQPVTEAPAPAPEKKQWKPRPIRTLDQFSDASAANPKHLADAFAAADETMRVALRDGASADELEPSLSTGRAPSSLAKGDLPCGATVIETGVGLLIENGQHATKPLGSGELALVWDGEMSGPGRYAILVTPSGRLYRADPWDLVPAKAAALREAACWIPGPLGRDKLWEAVAPAELQAHVSARRAHQSCVDRIFEPVKQKVAKLGKEIVVKDGRLWVYRNDYLQGLVDQAFQKQQRVCKPTEAKARKAITALLAKWETHVTTELSRIQ